MVERMEREQEIRRRSGLFKKEAERFFKNLPERLEMRMEAEAREEVEQQDFEDAILVMEEMERIKAEEIARLRLRKQEEKERMQREALLEQERIERELAEEAERNRVQAELDQIKQYEQDMVTMAPFFKLLDKFENDLSDRLQNRAKADDAWKALFKNTKTN